MNFNMKNTRNGANTLESGGRFVNRPYTSAPARNRARTLTALGLSMALSLSLLTGCGASAVSGSAESTANLSAAADAESTLLSAQTDTATAEKLDASAAFSKRDLSGDWDESEAETITLNGSTATSTSKNVTVDGSIVTITGEGVYVLTGSLNGQVVVDAEGDKVQLVLQNATITNDSSAAIYVKQADKVFVTLAEGTENRLSTTGDFAQSDDNKVDAVIFSKDDLTLNGSGSLTVTTEHGHGIVSKDELTLAGVTLTVNVSGHALSGKDCVCVASGSYTLTAGKDGIHSENADDTSKGYILIEDGSFTINAEGDGLDASSTVQLDGGTLDITAGRGSANAEQKHEQFFGHGGPNQQQSAEQSAQQTAVQTAEDSQSGSNSAKGVKADVLVLVDGAKLTVDSADDAIHSNDDVTLASGTLRLTTGDDGVHAGDALTITGGSITIPSSYEGLEGKTIDISGGQIVVTASDDGLNAAGGNDSSGTQGPMGGFDQFAAQEGVSITISGGSVTVNAEGDGLDTNGDLTVTGGEVVVYGPLNSGNGAIDHNGAATISGGILVALSRSGMEEGFDTDSTQGTIAVSLDSAVTGTLTLKDSNGTVLLTYDSPKEYSVVQLSCSALKSGETYTLTAGEESVTIEMDSLHYGQLTGMGGRGGHDGRMPGNDQNGTQNNGSEDAQNGPNGQNNGPNGQNGGSGDNQNGPNGGFGGHRGGPGGKMGKGGHGPMHQDGQNQQNGEGTQPAQRPDSARSGTPAIGEDALEEDSTVSA